ncbi:unnamed protein product [Paramecium primaurelia]|uniref:ATP-grasp domain-containing protein n=1 Tax=Paramecium primaurelia TaxID=5886 RepID=A0A8S1KWW5_PARPR|nr:unnamed protein product [Paramecium primaurelia]
MIRSVIKCIFQIRQPKVLYMINPDPIFYAEMDDLIINQLTQQNAQVQRVNLQDISFTVGNEFKFYINNELIDFDAFLAYGYMNPKHYLDYLYINQAVHASGRITLHKPETEHILYNKLLQYINFSKYKIPFPKIGTAFSINSFKSVIQQFDEEAIMKDVHGYSGIGVHLTHCRNNSVEMYSRALWKQEQQISQVYIDDCPGKSVRVLVIGGKAASVAEFKFSKNFRSVGLSEEASVESLMNSEKKDIYFDLAEKACLAIDDNITIGGVDILDSKRFGLQVLEVNSCPEICDSINATNLPLLEYFGQAFLKKIKI